jgi:hypothetical protein
MGKSFKKYDFIGNGSGSEKYDKRIANRSLRCNVRRLLRQDPFIEILPLMRELSDVWCFNKDGKSWFGNLKNGNNSMYPHIPYLEDPYFIELYRKYKRK